MTDTLAAMRSQYEAYPYPARDPADEAKRLVTGSPSDLDELNHYVFGGQLDFAKPFRALIAGGGTGDGAIMLAQQCAEAGVPAAIAYLDLSDASRAIAEARARKRGLTNITFRRGSLFDLDGTEKYDYIDCCGVLHHLERPEQGLAALAESLAPGGGMGVMVYGRFGRAGVYPLQDALRMLADGLPDSERLDLAKRLVRGLPPTNGFKRNPFLSDHLASDAGLYDLLLHSRDRAYTVPEVFALAAGAGLAVTAFIEPARYDPATYLRDPKLLARLAKLPFPEQAALAEQIGGSMTKHIVYLTRVADAAQAVAQPAPKAVPVLKGLDGAAFARGLLPGGGLKAELGGLAFTLPMPRLAGPILARIDGRANLADIHHGVVAQTGALAWEPFLAQFGQLYAALNGVNKLLLRFPAL